MKKVSFVNCPLLLVLNGESSQSVSSLMFESLGFKDRN